MKSCLLLILSVMTGCEASFEVNGSEEGRVEFTCEYSENYPDIMVEDPGGNDIRSTKKDEWEKKGRLLLYHDTKNKILRVVIEQIQKEDIGKYECDFYQDSPGEPMSPVPELNREPVNVAIIAVPIVAALLLVLILVLVYKRCSKHTSNEEVQNNEDFGYEEIEEHPNKHGSGTAMKTIYVTANHPTIPSDSSHYSYITHPNNSCEVSDDTYSTVKNNGQCRTYSTVNYPTSFSEHPLYSTINTPQEN